MKRWTIAAILVLVSSALVTAQNAKKGGLSGWDYFKQKHYDVALELLEKDHRFYPQSHEILDGIGWCKFFLGDLDGAQVAFTEALRLDADYRFSRMGLDSIRDARLGPILRAESLLASARYREAITAYRALLETGPKADIELRAHRGLGYAHHYLGDSQEALREFQKAIRIDKKDALTSAGIGYVQLAREKYSQADIAFESALEADPDLDQVRLSHGWSALGANNTTAALRRFEAALARDPRSWGAAYGIAWTHARRSDDGRAIASFRQALQLSPEAATGELQDWIVQGGGRSVLLLDLGFALIERGDSAAALRVFQAAPVDGDRARYLFGEALARLNSGDNESASRLARALVDRGEALQRDLRIDDAGTMVTLSSWTVLGWALLRLGEYEEAGEAFSKALEGDGRWADAWCGLGWVELAARRQVEAETRFARSLELVPDYAGSVAGMKKVAAWRLGDYDRAWTLMAAGELQQARVLLESLRNDQSGRFPAGRLDLLDYSLAEVARRSGKAKEAIELFESALRRNQALGDARLGLARALVDGKRYGEAVAVLDIVMAERPDDAESRRLAAWALIASNQFDRALEQLEVWTTAFPADAELADRKGRLLYERGRYIEARIAFQAAIAADLDRIPIADLDAMIAAHDEMKGIEGSLGWALLERRRFDESILRFERAIAAEPGLKSHLKGIALAESAAGRFKLAAKHGDDWLSSLDKSASARAERRAFEMTLGWDLYTAGEAKLALDRFKEVEKRESGEAGVDLLNALGWTWLAMDKALKAREYFLKALSLSPRLESALQGLESVNKALGS